MPIIRARGCSGGSIKNVTGRHTDVGVDLQYCSDLSVENVHVEHCEIGVDAIGCRDLDVSDVKLKNGTGSDLKAPSSLGEIAGSFFGGFVNTQK